MLRRSSCPRLRHPDYPLQEHLCQPTTVLVVHGAYVHHPKARSDFERDRPHDPHAPVSPLPGSNLNRSRLLPRVPRTTASSESQSARPRSTPYACLPWTARSSPCQSQKNQHRTIESHNILVIQPPDALAHFRLRHSRELVDHQPGARFQAITLIRLHDQTKQWRRCRICRERANRDGCGCIEAIVLKDDDRARLTRVVLHSCNCPYLAAPHD